MREGTPVANQFGGWKIDLPIVESFHTLADIVNAITEAGFCIKRMMEPTDADIAPTSIMCKLLGVVAIVGRKV